MIRKPNRIYPRCKEKEAASYSTYCKPCASEYQTANMKKRGYDWISKRREEIKALVQKAKDKPCMDCGIKYHPYVMAFDHVEGEKKFAVSLAAQRGMSLKTVQDEIAKCELVCSNCHRIRTGTRLGILG